MDHAGAGRRRTDDHRHADAQHRHGRGVEAAMILRTGLTGGLASGKSTITRIFAALGCVTIDADQIVARLYQPGQAGHEALVRTYGAGLPLEDGTVDRRKLARIAFA